MLAALPRLMPADVKRALFLSYASQDAVAARRICDTLRAGGIVVWFDQSELKGGEAWDASIRRQVAECALFLAVVSENTQSRREGYFRLEWKLADERTHLMAEGTPFILPVTIDGTTERGALVPKSFFAVQWTKAPGGGTPAALVERVKDLLQGGAARDSGSVSSEITSRQPRATAKPVSRVPAVVWIATVAFVVVTLAVGIFLSRKPTNAGAETRPPTAEKSASSANAKAVAVLPFENLSAEPDSAYLADGIHGEVITAVGKISALTVIGRTSVLPYADVKKRNLRQIAADLGVASVVEGRVQRAGKQVRITVELVDTQSGRQLWANQFNSEFSDVFAVQASIAREVAATLRATLTAREQTLIDRRLTTSPVAYELYLRARSLDEAMDNQSRESMEHVVELYDRVVANDPGFALAFVQLARVHGLMYWFGSLDPTPARRVKVKAARDAALRLAPTAPETRLAVGAYIYYVENDWPRALAEFQTAEASLPNDSQLAYVIGNTHRRMGNLTAALAAYVRSVELNPRDQAARGQQMWTLSLLRRYAGIVSVGADYPTLFPTETEQLGFLAAARLELSRDRGAYLQAYSALPPGGADSLGLVKRYRLGLMRGDITEAERVLGDPRVKAVACTAGVISEPVELHRALVAHLQGDREKARTQATETLAWFRGQTWTRRQEAWAAGSTALAHALAGHSDEAVRLATEAFKLQQERDACDAMYQRPDIARVFLALDRRAEALEILREMMREPCLIGPEQVRLDPFWSRLKDDPRFEEILKAAKPL